MSTKSKKSTESQKESENVFSAFNGLNCGIPRVFTVNFKSSTKLNGKKTELGKLERVHDPENPPICFVNIWKDSKVVPAYAFALAAKQIVTEIENNDTVREELNKAINYVNKKYRMNKVALPLF